MWLALRNRCWMGDRCVLCDQRTETIDHLMVQCPTARAIWYQILSVADLAQFTPQPQ
jgi:hypothetical protein